VPSLVLVCPSNSGCGSFTEITAVSPSRTSSPPIVSAWPFPFFCCCAMKRFSARVSAVRKPMRWAPPSTVLMLFAKEKTLSLYESLYWSAISMETGTSRFFARMRRSPAT
jgi:hypothetical protein